MEMLDLFENVFILSQNTDVNGLFDVCKNSDVGITSISDNLGSLTSNPNFNMTNLFTGGIFLAIVLAIWGRIKAVFWYFMSFVIFRHSCVGRFYKYAATYAWDNLKNRRSLAPIFKDGLYGSGKEARLFIKETGFRNLRLVWFGWVPVLVTMSHNEVVLYAVKPFLNQEKVMLKILEHYYLKMDEEFDRAMSLEKTRRNRFFSQYVRGSLNDLTDMKSGSNKSLKSDGREGCPQVSDENLSLKETENLNIGRRVNYTDEEFRRYSTFTNEQDLLMDNLFLTDDMLDLKKKLKRWFDHKDWFLERSIQWKRGVLLHGEPGTGKTSYITALAEYFNVPAYIFDLATFNNQDLESEWERIKSNTPCFVVFEDFDSVFNGRDNVYAQTQTMTGKPISFDCVLNVLDGAVKYDGIVVFITTNYIDKIDAALGGQNKTRPGRIDYVYEMNGIGEAGKRFIAEKVFRDMNGEKDLIEEAMKDCHDMTPAQFKEKCINLALFSYEE
jgi:hypothetical protein